MEKLSLDLPPGYRFSPKEKELIEVFLKPKITGNDRDICFVPEIEFYEHEPWDLQHKSGIDSKDQEWFFFNALSLKHQNGNKKNRTTKEGYWKATGKDTEIKSRGSLIGMKKTLVYHRGRSPNGEGTKWVMHEYRTTQEEFDGTNPGQKAFVLCRLFNNEEGSNKGGSAKSDVTVPVQSNNYNYHNADVAKNQAAELTSTKIDFYVAKPSNMYNVSSPGDSPSSLSPIAPDVLTSKIFEDSTLIIPPNNLDECFHSTSCSQNNIAVDNETLKNMASFTDNVSCGGSDANAQVDQDLDMREAFETGFIRPQGPYCNSFSLSTLTSVTPAVSSPTIAEASLKEAESMVAPAPVPPELGSEADNYTTGFRFSPATNSDGITTNTIAPIMYKNDGYISYVDRNQVEEVTSDKVEAQSNMFSISPVPLDSSILSPLHSQVQAELYSSCICHPSANDLNHCHWGLYDQYGMNEPDPIIIESWGLSLNNLDETRKTVSLKDNGSCGGSDANAQF